MDSQASSKALKSRRWTKSNGLFPLGLGQGHTQKASRKITFSEGVVGEQRGPPFPLGFYIKPEEQQLEQSPDPISPCLGGSVWQQPYFPPPSGWEPTCAEAPGKGGLHTALWGPDDWIPLRCLLNPDLWLSAHQVLPGMLDKLVIWGSPKNGPGQSSQQQLCYDGASSRPGWKAHFISLPLWSWSLIKAVIQILKGICSCYKSIQSI